MVLIGGLAGGVELQGLRDPGLDLLDPSLFRRVSGQVLGRAVTPRCAPGQAERVRLLVLDQVELPLIVRTAGRLGDPPAYAPHLLDGNRIRGELGLLEDLPVGVEPHLLLLALREEQELMAARDGHRRAGGKASCSEGDCSEGCTNLHRSSLPHRVRRRVWVVSVRAPIPPAPSVVSVITTVRTSAGTAVGRRAASRYSRTRLRTPSPIGCAPPPASRRSTVPARRHVIVSSRAVERPSPSRST